MIDDKSFSKEWIDGLRNREGYGKAHPEIMEKMIYALYLVEKLVEEELDFVFKGGTCLSLLIPEIRRFSIDVDIITPVKKEDLEKILSIVIDRSRFTRYELDEKRSFKNNFPKAHYDFYFNSEFDNSEKNILLDIIFDQPPYPEMVTLPIQSNIFISEGARVNVKLPSVDSITGDKLTAFAPNTIGIPYKAGEESPDKALQIVKQMFDLGRLFGDIKDFKIVAESFKSMAVKQLNYLNLDISINDILDDTIDTAFLIGMQNKNREKAKIKYDQIFSGIRSFPVFLPNPRFSIYNAIEDSAKAALIAAKIKASNFDMPPSIDKQNYNPKDFPLSGKRYTIIYKMIKAMPNLSVFYWHHITKLLS